MKSRCWWWCHCAGCISKYCWCCHTCFIKINFCAVNYCMNPCYFSVSVHVHSCLVGIFSVVSLAATDYRKGVILPLLIKDMEWLQMGLCFVFCQCGQLHTAVWRVHGCCCRRCCCGCCLIMSLWHRAAVSLADRQAFALVTAASCHLGPSAERGRTGTCQWEDMV